MDASRVAANDGALGDAAPQGPDDPFAIHATTPAELWRLAWPPDGTPIDASAAAPVPPLVRELLGAAPGRFNQGNRPIARHSVGKRACLEGLRGVVLQTDQQRATCRGKPNMVPVYGNGVASSAKVCIDIFEYPNRACELPMVWGTPSEAAQLCALDGKRLCTQGEWTTACRADPTGKADWAYAYGNDLDLTICNTDKKQARGPTGLRKCNTVDAQSAWATCSTETEPSGSFPSCRSRLGVYDQHGNVAEMMTRKGEDGVVYTQLKGSAFFYVEVAREPGQAQDPKRAETYPDSCTYDPRWHVEVLEHAVHSNYHLGFRCCLPL